MTKLKNYLDTPITWRSYWKFGGICCIISLIYCVIYYTIMGWISPVEWMNDKIDRVKEKFHR